MTRRTRFDFPSFYAALSATVKARNTTWKAVSEQTGVSQTTLSRMSNGRQPDAASLTALSAWSGLDPVDFMSTLRREREPIAMVSKLLREDPNLDRAGADALETIITAAYDRFRRKGGPLVSEDAASGDLFPPNPVSLSSPPQLSDASMRGPVRTGAPQPVLHSS